MKKPLTNLDKISLAWSWGWSAKLRPLAPLIDPYTERNRVLMCHDDWILIGFDTATLPLNKKECEAFEITGYLYAGQLAGSEPIPEGTRFRVKETGEIGDYKEMVQNGLITFHNLSPSNRLFNKSEIEPYFD